MDHTRLPRPARRSPARSRRSTWRRLPLVLLAVLLLSWPLAYRYSSVGVDVDRPQDGGVVSTHYRLRWPGDGSVLVGTLRATHPPQARQSYGVDAAALVLQKPRPMPAQSRWNRLGFWNVRGTDDSAAAAVDGGADEVRLVGVPHGLLVLVAGVALLAWARRLRGGAAVPTA